MAENFDTTIKIGMKADTSGGVATEKQLDRLTQKAKDFEKQANKSSSSFMSSFERMGQSVNKLRGMFMGLGGVTAIIGGIVTAFKAWRDSAREVQANIDSIKIDAAKESLKQILEAEEKIADAIRKGNQARKEAEALEDRRLKIVRDLEDANLRVEEAKEKAAVGEGPDKDLQLKRIDEKYAAIRSGKNADRSVEDAKKEYGRKINDANAAEQEAKALRESVENLRKESKDWSRSAGKDAATAARLSGSWLAYNPLGGMRDRANNMTEQSKRKLELSRTASEKADAAEKKAEEAEDRAKTLRAEAAMTYGTINVARMNQKAESIEAGIRTGEISAEQANRNLQRSADQETINAAPGKIAAIKSKIEGYQGRIDSADQKVAQEQLELKSASDRLSTFNANVGTRRTGVDAGRSALEAEVRQEENDVHAAQTAAAGIKSSLGAAIKELLEELRRIEADAKSAKSRMKFNESEAK